jgi:hypothetical protein
MTQSTSLILALASPDVRIPEFAPFVVVAFLGTACFLFAAAVGSAIAFTFRKPRIARGIGAAALLAAFGYTALLLGASFLSRERTLPPGAKKYFCAIDCHVAHSVARAALWKDLGRPPEPGAARGHFVVVTLETWFDPSTIAPFRGNGPLTPGPRVAYLVDSDGRRHDPSRAGQKAWEDAHGRTTPLNRELRPGESYETTLVFDVPEGTEGTPGLRLFLGDPPGIDSLVIGHENSPLHGKSYFALAPKARDDAS